MTSPITETNLLYTLRKETGTDLPIDIWYEGDIWFFHPIGTIDTTTSSDLETTIMEGIHQGMKWIILDMTDVAYISSAGLRVLILAAKTLKANNGELILSTLNKTVTDIISVTGLKKLLRIYPDNESAASAFHT